MGEVVAVTAVYEPVDQSRFAAVAELAGLHGPRYAWRAFAACAGQDPELFFPGQGGDARTAKAICARCPVADICLDVALRNNEHHGIWGGRSERERRAMRERPNIAEAVIELLAAHGGRLDVTPNELAETTGFTTHGINAALVRLELAGVVTRTHGHTPEGRPGIVAITLNKETPAP